MTCDFTPSRSNLKFNSRPICYMYCSIQQNFEKTLNVFFTPTLNVSNKINPGGRTSYFFEEHLFSHMYFQDMFFDSVIQNINILYLKLNSNLILNSILIIIREINLILLLAIRNYRRLLDYQVNFLTNRFSRIFVKCKRKNI